MQRLVTAGEMRAMDREVIENRGIPGFELMTLAGEGVAEAILETFGEIEDARVVVLAGRGNNGGDGFVAARVLLESEARPVVVTVGCKPDDLTGDAALARDAWLEVKGEILSAPDQETWDRIWPGLDGDADIVVDAMLGTGARGEPRGVIEAAILSLEDVAVPIMAVDIPSGVDADTGAVPGVCVHADLTVTLGHFKRGHMFYPGRHFVGDLWWADIGIPSDVKPPDEDPAVFTLEVQDVVELLPDRDPEMHKGDRGRLLVVGGSAGLTGAVALAAEAAARAGAGLVTAGIPISLNDVLEAKLTEAMTLPLPQLDVRALSREAFDAIALFSPGRLSAFALGPGMGRHPSTRALVRKVVAEIDLPTVLDADGLFAFNGEPDLLGLSAAGEKLVLTPHPGEFAALTGESPETIADRRIEVAAEWARRLGVIMVLKGAPTVIASASEALVVVNPTGSEALATGGTGDVLTGFIGGFLAQGLEPMDAAVLAVYLHGLTADFVTAEWGSPYGFLASDLLRGFPEALGALLSPNEDRE